MSIVRRVLKDAFGEGIGKRDLWKAHRSGMRRQRADIESMTTVARFANTKESLGRGEGMMR